MASSSTDPYEQILRQRDFFFGLAIENLVKQQRHADPHADPAILAEKARRQLLSAADSTAADYYVAVGRDEL